MTPKERTTYFNQSGNETAKKYGFKIVETTKTDIVQNSISLASFLPMLPALAAGLFFKS